MPQFFDDYEQFHDDDFKEDIEGENEGEDYDGEEEGEDVEPYYEDDFSLALDANEEEGDEELVISYFSV